MYSYLSGKQKPRHSAGQSE